MIEPRVHLIFWGKFKYTDLFCEESAENMANEEECHTWGWKTGCGKVFWPFWEGTTKWEQITCCNCMKAFKRLRG